MNMNKLKPNNIALGESINFSTNEIENQITLFNALEHHKIILPNTKNKFSLSNLITNEQLNRIHSGVHFYILTKC